MIGLICIDVDGTLIGSSGSVLPAVWDTAARARSMGVRLAICSGRPAFGRAWSYAEQLDPTGWHIFQNGASVVRLPDGETRSRGLSPAAVDTLVRRSRVTGHVLELYTDTEYAVESDDPLAREHARLLGVPWAPRELMSIPGTIVRAQWVIPHAEVDDVLSLPVEDVSIATSLSPLMPHTSFINMTPAGVDKGDALRRVAAAYDVPLEQCMMIGDSENDLPAMRTAGTAIAMGNAEPDVRAAAKYIVSHVDEAGLVEALELALELEIQLG